MSFIKQTEKELTISKNNYKIKYEKHLPVNYENKVCVKPWGYEYLIHLNDKIGIWFLRINKGQQTSLHTHFNKDTLLIAFKGTGKINLIDNKTIILNEMEYIFLPKYSFHGLSTFSDYTLFIEIEVYDKNINFSDKNDLLRIQDVYERDNTGYASSVNVCSNLEDLKFYNHFYLNTREYKEVCIEDNIIKYTNVNNPSEIDDKYLNVLIEGEVYIDGIIAKEGSILKKNDNMNFLSDNVVILSLYSMDKNDNSKVIYDLEHLNVLLKNINKEKIILSSGCFDIIHVGHLHTLKKAKECGDCLMVCLSSDEQIQSLKGENRPINCYKDRIDLFKTIKYVDYVILYNEENIEKEKTLDNIMKQVNPYAWVKGTDYTKENILYKHPHLQNIILLDNIENKSTTNIIKKIISNEKINN